MRPINEQLAADLAEAGKREFLEKGFRGASMRNIAASLGVTTGAIYRYYADKEALFDGLVSGPADYLETEYRRRQDEFAEQPLGEQLRTLPDMADDGQLWMMEYLYDEFDAFKLIACCAVGTKYENYLDILTAIEDRSGHMLVEKMHEAGMKVLPIDDELIHILSSALFSGMFETVRHDMPRKKAMQHMRSLKDFYSAGWFKILGI